MDLIIVLIGILIGSFLLYSVFLLGFLTREKLADKDSEAFFNNVVGPVVSDLLKDNEKLREDKYSKCCTHKNSHEELDIPDFLKK